MSERRPNLRVVFFASLREVVGQAEVALAAADLSELKCALGARFGDEVLSALTASNVRVAVNQTLIDGEACFADGDEVAFLPPVTGG